MKKRLRYILSIIALSGVLFFCVSASAGITGSATMIKQGLSEPMSMMLIGVGLIGFGCYIKRMTIQR